MISDVLKESFFSNTILQYFLFIGILIVSLALLSIIRKNIIKKIVKGKNVENDSNDKVILLTIEKRTIPILFCISIYLSIQVLNITTEIEKIINYSFIVGISIFCINLILFSISSLLEKSIQKEETEISKKQTIRLLSSTIKIVVWGIAIFILLDNLGINISTLVAGLGIGGIAIALAAQTVLGDLFSCFVIYLDRPFEIGDYITIDSYSGTIEHIGIKTTRIRSLSGEQLVFSNSDLTTSRVRNYKRMEKRRINFKLSIAYETELQKVKGIPEIIEEIIGSIPDTTYERTHFSSYGEYGLIFESVYYVNTSDYVRYMDIQQEINIKIKGAFEDNKIEFTYPTHTIYIKKNNDI